jgi:hypothetical protein
MSITIAQSSSFFQWLIIKSCCDAVTTELAEA